MKQSGHAVPNKAIVITIAGREQWLSLIGNYRNVEDGPRPADVIHVIAGDDYRTDYAVHLSKAGDAPVLFVTGGWRTMHQSD